MFRTLLFSRISGPLILIAIIAGLFGVNSLISYFTKKQVYDQQATALIKQIEYIEQLHLVTYYYEEIITIGTRDRINTLVQDFETDLKEEEDALFPLEFDMAKAEAEYQAAVEAYFAEDTALSNIGLRLRQARARLDEIKGGNGGLYKLLEDAPKRFGRAVESAYANYVIALRAFENPSAAGINKKTARRQLRAAEKLLNESLEEEKRIRSNTRSKYLELYEHARSRQQGTLKRIRKQKDDAQKALNKATRRYERQAKKVATARGKWERARAQWEELQRQDRDIQPKLLIVAPAEVSGFVDLSKLAYRSVEIPAEGTAQPIMQVILPPAQMDSVRIDLDSTDHFDLGRKMDISLTEDGVYFEIFQQLKDALEEKRGELRERALEKGILTETQRLAAEYVRDFVGGLGYQVEFVDSFNAKVDSLDGGDFTDTTEFIFQENIGTSTESDLEKVPDSMLAPMPGSGGR
ncbi:MAG: DUF4230 domain-containing protein [Bacteroidota bacterium]